MGIKTKISIVILSLLFFSNITAAQVKIGFLGGVNHSIFNSTNAHMGTRSYVTGFIIGGVINFQLNQLFSLQAEPRYTQMGFNVNITEASLEASAEVHSEFIELPLLVVINFTESSLKPLVSAGINIGYLQSIEQDSKINGEKTKIDVIRDYNRVNVSLDLGIGLQYHLTPASNIIFNTRYSHGLSNINKLLNGSSEGTYTRGIQVLLGAMFKI
ncbi:MAG: PorT family protein [Ignavibacteriae bacterium]|nr:PorT family protein [Ignavibacteriota bacterium]NOG99260.1 PorT family protein [Ignavibacteriota bacterium]